MRRLSLIAAAVFILFSYGALFLGKSKDGKIKRTRPKIKETSAVYYFNSRLLMSRQYFNSACLWPQRSGAEEINNRGKYFRPNRKAKVKINGRKYNYAANKWPDIFAVYFH